MKAEAVVGREEMQRGRVMDARADPRGSQLLLDTVAVRNAHDIEVIDRPRPGWLEGQSQDPGDTTQELGVGARVLAPKLVPAREMAELHRENPRLDGVESAVVALELVGVLRRLAVVAEHAARPGE